MTLLLASLLFFFATSLLFYILFAGADFGAGILELFLWKPSEKHYKKLITKAIAPVWEANHVWIILAIVILFMGFPKVYSWLCLYLHLPLLCLLLGITGRGCAFTFRHYDTLSAQYHRLYSWIFVLSSIWASFFLGVVGGAAILGKINPSATTYYDLYLSPWLNSFCITVGIFTSALCAFIAAVYLTGEAEKPEEQKVFQQKASWANLVMIILGGLVFLTAEQNGLDLTSEFLRTPLSLSAFVAATLLLAPFWLALRMGKRRVLTRVLAAAMVGLVLIGWYGVQYPIALHYREGGIIKGISFVEAAAPDPTLKALLIALIIGSFLIFPALFYLLKIFKAETMES